MGWNRSSILASLGLAEHGVCYGFTAKEDTQGVGVSLEGGQFASLRVYWACIPKL